MMRAFRIAVVAAGVLMSACGGNEPRPIVLHEDSCTYCKMTISDARFGGQVVMKTGRVNTFDSIDCLVGWVRTADSTTIAGVYTIDLQHPGTFVNVHTAGFLRGGIMKSPMGESVVGFASVEVAEQQRTMLGGTVVTWSDLLVPAAGGQGAGR